MAVISSSPSLPYTTAPRCTPKLDKTCANGSTKDRSYTPISSTVAPAGFAKGPKILNTVLTPIAFRTGPAYFIASWYTGANIKQIFASSKTFLFCSPLSSNFTPNASSTSAAPHLLDTLRFPCLAIGIPAAANRIADVVEMLKVLLPSPPVPTISTTVLSCGTDPAFSRITSAKAVISVTLGPFACKPPKKAAIGTSCTSPLIIAFIVVFATS